MKKLNIDFLFPLLALILLVLMLSIQLFKAPPLGKVLDPFTGAIQNEAGGPLETGRLYLRDASLHDSVQVYFDQRKVPHIYARNAADLYFAQGYVTASLRLWQMDFLSYVSAGRLSEIFKDGFWDYDRNQRRIGMLAAAKASLKVIEQNPETNQALESYTNGVNAWIRSLQYKTLPLEYKLFDYSPEPWTKLKTVLVMKQMANTLSGYEEDYAMTQLMLTLGETRFNELFPGYQAPLTPMTVDKDAPVNNALAYTKKPDYLDYSFMTAAAVVAPSTYNPKLGSNSWAVSGRKTKSGYPILCSDPHLNLTLPAIWLEMQLCAPGVNVYGVSIPGTPAIIIGFNKDVAWGITNGADDVKDWYKLKITPDYKKYEMDGQWRNLPYTVEAILRRGQATLYDTIYQPIQGPVVSSKNYPGAHPELMNCALQWKLQEGSNEFLAFMQLNKAKNYTDFEAALQHYASPSQNFTFACKDNTIAVQHQGSIPLKWAGQGKFILDGTRGDHLHPGNIPQDSLPRQLDPECGYVLSANQHPTDDHYAFYYHGYFSEQRANRIGQLLAKGNRFDVAGMEAMQLDNTVPFAVEALPLLVQRVDTNRLTVTGKALLRRMAGWQGRFDAGDEQAKLFELWWKNIKDNTWDELSAMPGITRMPDDYVLLRLIREDPTSTWFDRQGTTAKEQAGDIIQQAFVNAGDDYLRIQKTENMAWSNMHKVSIMHLSNIRLFSKMNLPSAGYPEAINASSYNFGPSWRMVVALGERPQAYGVYAGGQSGNTGSRYFDNFVGDWNKGIYYPLTYFVSEQEARDQTDNRWTLQR